MEEEQHDAAVRAYRTHQLGLIAQNTYRYRTMGGMVYPPASYHADLRRLAAEYFDNWAPPSMRPDPGPEPALDPSATRRVFSTSYHEGRSAYVSEVVASSRGRAEQLIAERRLGERLIAERDWPPRNRPPSHWITDPHARLTQQVHALTFLAFLATSSGVASARDFLGDEGILHSFVHIATDYPLPLYTASGRTVSQEIEELVEEIRAVEARVPGLWDGVV